MKTPVKMTTLKYLIPVSGVLGLLLRITLYKTGIDGRGLLVAGHWANTALWALTILTGIGIFLLTRKINTPADPVTAYPASQTRGLGAFAAMAGIALTTLMEFSEFSSRLHLIVWVLGLCSAVAMGITGICRLRGKRTHCLLLAVVSLYFALHMVARYQLWSSDPQLQDYCFYLCAHAALMLTAYQHAAFDADMGSHRTLWFFSLAGVYLCLVSLPRSMDPVLLLGCGIWAFTNLTDLSAPSATKTPEG